MYYKASSACPSLSSPLQVFRHTTCNPQEVKTCPACVVIAPWGARCQDFSGICRIHDDIPCCMSSTVLKKLCSRLIKRVVQVLICHSHKPCCHAVESAAQLQIQQAIQGLSIALDGHSRCVFMLQTGWQGRSQQEAGKAGKPRQNMSLNAASLGTDLSSKRLTSPLCRLHAQPASSKRAVR